MSDRPHKPYLAALCGMLLWAHLTVAQEPAGAPPQNRAHGAGKSSTASGAQDFAGEGRRATALSLIDSLAQEARHYRDQTLRARVLAHAGDTLWQADAERSRALFRQAWEAAEAVDKEGAERVAEARRTFLAGRGGSGMIPPAPNVRAEVLRLASRRDHAFGEELLARLEEATEQEAKASPADFFDPTEPPSSIAKRLELARQLLDVGDIERAIQFADPALKSATSQGIIFLSALRQRRASAADERYAALLERSAADPAADATTVSLLSSYVFTPSLLVTATRRGRLSNQWDAPRSAPDLSPALRAAFFRTAGRILLRPTPPPEADNTAAGRAGTYFTIARLLPLFERHDPERAPALHAKLAELTQDAPQSFRTGEERMLTLGLTPARDEAQEAIEQIDAFSTAAERDRAYVDAARAAALKGDERARSYADKIGNEHLRKRVLAFVDFVAVRNALGRSGAEEAYRRAREGDLLPFQRVWAYTEAARLLEKSSPARAAELLGEARTEARRIDPAEVEHAYALIAVATHFLRVDRPRGWEVAVEAVKAANGVERFEGEYGKLTARLLTTHVTAVIHADAPAFTLTELFGSLAAEDLNRAVELAKGLKGESPRALATMAVARAVLKRSEVRESR